MTTMRTSIHGLRLGLGDDDNLVSHEIEVTSPAVDALITIAASQTSPRTVTVQLLTANGNAVKTSKSIDFEVYADVLGAGFAATGGSTGLADDTTAGASLALVAKKIFRVRTNAAGLWSGTWTDTAHEVAYLGVRMPSSGRVVISQPLTTA